MRIPRCLSFVITVLALLAARPASAVVYTCSGGDSQCLYSSVFNANQSQEADTIILQAGTYSLVDTMSCLGPPVHDCDALGPIRGILVIIGAGRDATIIQPAPNIPMRIFEVAPGASLSLRDLTIRGAHDGGVYGGLGILNAGQVTLTNVAIRDNVLGSGVGGCGAGIRNEGGATISMSNSIVSGNTSDTVGGICSNGSLTLVSSAVTGNSSGNNAGGGIYNSGTANVQRSTVSGNSAPQGGGIMSTGSLTVDSSAITANTSMGLNGPMGGAGIFSFGSTTIRNSTIAQNLAEDYTPSGGGIYVGGGALLLSGSTVADNRANSVYARGTGGGIANYTNATTMIQDSIVARNAADDGSGSGTGPDCYGTITSLSHNIVGNTNGCTFTPQVGDYIGDPRLGAFTDQIKAADGILQGNGHVPLLSTSPAIDAGNTSVCTATDQLGYPRVDASINSTGRTCDIGASEYAPSVYPWVTLVSSQTVRNPTPLPGYPGGTITITSQYRMNVDRVEYPVFVLQRITDGAVLTNCDPPSPCTGSGRLTPNVGSDSVWSVGEVVTVTYVFGITKKITAVTFATDVVGYPHLP